jgi:hypothetical protein
VPRQVELRCATGVLHGDADAGNLLAKLVLGGSPVPAELGNLIELACPHCRALLRRSGRSARLVLHRYDFAGDLVETVVVE